jgi:hypothetical protein
MVGNILSIANKTDWGLILGCFKWTYAALSPSGLLRDRHVPLNIIFGTFAGVALLSVLLVLLIKPQPTEPSR